MLGNSLSVTVVEVRLCVFPHLSVCVFACAICFANHTLQALLKRLFMHMANL
jgi:hypothetical protein